MAAGFTRRGWVVAGLALGLLAACVPGARAQGVRVALLPAAQSVAPGDSFDVSIEVTQSGSSFNGFDATIGYDPAALTLVQRSPLSQQEGTYFKNACGNRFHLFKPGADRDTITDVLLCSGMSLPGPGQIYRLRFKASSTPQVTHVRVLALQFYDAGLYVNPDSSTDAVIGIGQALGVGDGPPRPGLRIQASPNPSRGDAQLRIDAPRGGMQHVTILDVGGRMVRHLEDGRFEPGIRTVRWDAKDDSGRRVRPGVYLAQLRTASEEVHSRFTLLH